MLPDGRGLKMQPDASVCRKKKPQQDIFCFLGSFGPYCSEPLLFESHVSKLSLIFSLLAISPGFPLLWSLSRDL